MELIRREVRRRLNERGIVEIVTALFVLLIMLMLTGHRVVVQ